MASQRKKAEALNDCIQAILESDESIETALARYPDLADELRPELGAAIKMREQQSNFDPRPGYVAASRHSLVEQIQSSEVPARPRLDLRFRPQPSTRMVATLILLLVLFVTSTGVAWAADDALPGESFYPVKIILEDFRLAITFNQQKDAEIHIHYAHNRLGEILQLAAEGRYAAVPIALKNHQRHVTRANQIALSLAGDKSEATGPVAASLAQALAQDLRLLEDLMLILPDQTRALVEDDINTSAFGQDVMIQLLSVADG
jgi:hypothetical protein